MEDQAGGLLLEDSAGGYWTLEQNEIVGRKVGEEAFQPATASELAEGLKRAAGGECVVLTTKNYVIVSRASRAYAEWCGALLERLRTAFLAYWERAGLELKPGEHPLPVLILKNKAQFAEYAIRDGAAAAEETSGYYSAKTNRVVLYDLTADEPGAALGEAMKRDEITRRLSKAPFNVATVVHEAVHQLSFNTGLQTRYADNPMWLSEGLAMYFEAPDLQSKTGWSGIGKVNPFRLKPFRDSLEARPADSLKTLIQNEDRFRSAETMPAAYAESWALVHYLATSKRGKFVEYLKAIGTKPPLVFDSAEERLKEFRGVFGDDLGGLDRDFVEFVGRQRVGR